MYPMGKLEHQNLRKEWVGVVSEPGEEPWGKERTLEFTISFHENQPIAKNFVKSKVRISGKGMPWFYLK